MDTQTDAAGGSRSRSTRLADECGRLRADTTLACEIVASPNFGVRIGARAPDVLVLHYTGMSSGQAALERLCSAVSQVSCHYFVWEDGRIVQLVAERDRAWHAGVSAWESWADVNSRSIGIEIANAGHPGGLPPFPQAQIDAVIALVRDICDRYAIAPWHVLAHSDVAPGRKIDPGEAFPWEKLHRHGVGHWVEPVPVTQEGRPRAGTQGEDVTRLQSQLVSYGYDLPVSGLFDARTRDVVAAFQRHFRPVLVDGVADTSTLRTLDHLLAARSGAAPDLGRS